MNSTLTDLDFSGNGLNDNGVKTLFSRLKLNTTLTTLHINLNKIGNEGIIELGSYLQTTSTLINFHIGNVKMKQKKLRPLLAGLKLNSSVISMTTGGRYYPKVGNLTLLNHQKMKIRQRNFVKVLLMIKISRKKRSSLISSLPLDILLYLARFFYRADFGLTHQELFNMTRSIIIST